MKTPSNICANCGHEKEAHKKGQGCIMGVWKGRVPEDALEKLTTSKKCPCKKFQPRKECNHQYEEDERFKGNGVIMLFGNIGDVKRETRVVCKKCGEVDYLEIQKVRK